MNAKHAAQEELLALLDSYHLSRDVMDLMLRGRSVIDSNHGIPIRMLEGAERFLLAYGYNLENPVEAAELLGNYQEALRFIKKYFLKPENPEGAELEIPKAFFELSDIRNLFVYASDKSIDHALRTRWACSILRVMHAISHLDKDLRHDYFSEIQKQVFDRFYKELHNEGDKLFLGKPGSREAVELVKFQTKPRKARDSVILKILHKKETLAEDVFDQIGVRFVTRNAADVVRVQKYLSKYHIVMPVNIRPSRSRNNLVDPLLFRRTWRKLRTDVLNGELRSPEQIERMLVETAEKGYKADQKEINANNPFSSANYRSIQFTCRQLIKYRNPVYEDVKQLRAALKNTSDPEVKKIVERLDLTQLTKEQRFFYPYEVQILDLKNHEEAESGQASHAAYKAAQAQQAMKRVLGQLVLS